MAKRTRIVIVGGVAGGASAAARARRLSEDAEIVMFERGEHISFANCGLPYHIGGDIAERRRLLVQTPEAMHKRFRIDVRTRTEVMAIDRERKEVTVRDLETGIEKPLHYDKLILSPGAAPFVPEIPGIKSERVLTLRNIADMDAIKARVDAETSRRVLVIGGGYVGLEMAEALRNRGTPVMLVELAEQVMGPADPEIASPLHQQLVLHGVDLRLGTKVAAFREGSDALIAELSTGESVECSFAVLAIGVKPETTLAVQADLKLGERGGIAVDDHMRTSDPDIFAVGDAVEVNDFVVGGTALVPLAGPANRQGRIAADNALGRDSAYRNTQGTAICKVFDLAVGMTGASEKTLKRTSRTYEKIYVHPADHASYYPGAGPISLKLLFDPGDGKILGAQAVGPRGIDKRIDVLAVAIRAGLTVFDLEHLELAYAPPYGSAKDPVNYAGFVASNVVRGDVKICHTEDVLLPGTERIVLDVRTPAEMEAGGIPGATNIPVDSLRERLGELPRDKEILVACQVGLRGYLACRILDQNGFSCRNLTGGYKTYSAMTAPVPEHKPDSGDMCDDTGSNSTGACELPAATATSTADPDRPTPVALKVDASGLQCPGPILQLRTAIDRVAVGDGVSITATDPGFATDLPAWCRSTGNRLLDLTPDNGAFKATIVKEETPEPETRPVAGGNALTSVVFSNDFDRAMAAFIIANGAASMGKKVTLFFTFWGLNILRKGKKVRVRKRLIERMFGWMMPRGVENLILSKMHMAGMGTNMMKSIMKKKHVPSLKELIQSALDLGVRLVACSMTMDIMGLKREELIDGIEEGGVAMYLNTAESGNMNLFI